MSIFTVFRPSCIQWFPHIDMCRLQNIKKYSLNVRLPNQNSNYWKQFHTYPCYMSAHSHGTDQTIRQKSHWMTFQYSEDETYVLKQVHDLMHHEITKQNKYSKHMYTFIFIKRYTVLVKILNFSFFFNTI